jgi:hypothetical protein
VWDSGLQHESYYLYAGEGACSAGESVGVESTSTPARATDEVNLRATPLDRRGEARGR